MNLIDWLQPTFTKVLEASMAASVLALLILMVQFALRRWLTPAWRFALLSVVVVRLLVPDFPSAPFSLFNMPYWFRTTRPAKLVIVEIRNNSFGNVPAGIQSAPEALTEVKSFPGSEANRFNLSSNQALALLWGFLSVLLLLRLFLGSAWLNLRLRNLGQVADPRTVAAYEAVCRELGIGKGPKLIATSLVDSPGLFGLFRPLLLLPSTVSTQLNSAELRHVFLHELAHWKRGDLITNWLLTIAHAIHWFNPVVWVVVRRLRLERELACDQLVLQNSSEEVPRDYGETILKLIESLSAGRSFASVVGIVEGKQAVRERIRQIKSFSSGKRKFQKSAWLILLVTIAVGLSNAQNKDAVQGSKTQQEVNSEKAETNRNLPVLNESYATLKAEYQEQERQYESAKKNYEEISARINASRPDSTGGASSEENKAFKLHQELQSLSHDELRKVLPSLVPDNQLDQLLSSLNKAEQEYAGLMVDKSEQHPEVQRIQRVIKTIDEQIENRIGGIMKGLQIKAGQASRAPSSTDEQALAFAKNNMENKARILEIMSRKLAMESASNPSGISMTNSARSKQLTSGKQEPLYTRTFKLDPELITENVKRFVPPMPGPVQAEQPFQARLKNYFVLQGINFETNAPTSGQPTTAIFFNESNGVLFVRETLAELDKIETALHVLNTRSYKIELYCKLVALPIEAAKLFSNVILTNSPPIFSTNAVVTLSSIMSDAQFQQLQKRLNEQSGVSTGIVQTNGLTTMSGLLTDPQFSNTVRVLDKSMNRQLPTQTSDWMHVVTNGQQMMDVSEALEGSEMLGAVSVFAYTGQTAVMRVAAGPKLEMHSSYQPENQVHQFSAEVTIPNGRNVITFTATSPIPEGQTFIFAKLAHLKKENGLPVLQDIPGVGKLFRSDNPTEKVILFFVTPKLVKEQINERKP